MFAGFYSLKFLGKIVYKCIANVMISGILYKNQHCNIYTGGVKSSRQEFIALYLILLGAVPGMEFRALCICMQTFCY